MAKESSHIPGRTYASGVAITPSDGTKLNRPTDAIYVGGAGDIVMRFADANVDVTFKAVPVGTILPVHAVLVKSTLTTATNLVALYA